MGIPGILHSMEVSLKQMGPVRTAQTLLKINQKDGFDCPGCAWPEADKRHTAEFSENGAKAVAEEATKRRLPPSFFAEHSVSEMRGWDDYRLGQQGRLTDPLYLAEGSDHYVPVTWERALGILADELKALKDPNEAIFYTSGRTSNEAAFLYQLLVRGLGTNNLPDCSNMCHESSGSALTETIGIGKGSVSLEDIYHAELILIAGQNPGTNHPRMLTALEKAKKNGAVIVATPTSRAIAPWASSSACRPSSTTPSTANFPSRPRVRTARHRCRHRGHAGWQGRRLPGHGRQLRPLHP